MRESKNYQIITINMQAIKDRYIPTGMTEYAPETGYPSDLCAVYVDMAKLTAIFYKGKSTKHLWFNRFRTASDMGKKINDSIGALIAWEDRKQERKEERKLPHTLKLGDILYSSWGYEQTNINFYQVTKLVGANTVQIREIASKIVSDDGGPTTHVIAVKDSFLSARAEWDKTGREMTKRVSNGMVRVSGVQTAYLWDGKPKYETASGWGH